MKKKNLDDYIDMYNKEINNTNGIEMILYTTNTVPYKYEIAHINKAYYDILYIWENKKDNNHDSLYSFVDNAINITLSNGIKYYIRNKYNEGVTDYIRLGIAHIIADIIGDIEENKDCYIDTYDYTNNYSISDFYVNLIASQNENTYSFMITAVNKTLGESVIKRVKKVLSIKEDKVDNESETIFSGFTPTKITNGSRVITLNNNTINIAHTLNTDKESMNIDVPIPANYIGFPSEYRSAREMVNKIKKQLKVSMCSKLPEEVEDGKLYLLYIGNGKYETCYGYEGQWYKLSQTQTLMY